MTLNINYGSGIDQEELHRRQTDPSLTQEATAKRTLPPGMYIIGPATKIDVRKVTPENADKRRNPQLVGRLEVHIQAPAVEAEKLEDGSFRPKTDGRRGVLFFDVSPEKFYATRQDQKRLDAAATLWGQAVTIWGLESAPITEVIEAFGKYTLPGYVGENYRLGKEYVNPRTPDEAREVIANGGTVNNVIRNFATGKKKRMDGD